MLTIIYAKCQIAECRYAVCSYAECRGAHIGVGHSLAANIGLLWNFYEIFLLCVMQKNINFIMEWPSLPSDTGSSNRFYLMNFEKNTNLNVYLS